MYRAFEQLPIFPAGMVMPGAMGMPMAILSRSPARRGIRGWKGES